MRHVEKQQEKNNMNDNNNDDSNTNNEKLSWITKQLSLITLPCKGQQGEKVLKSFKTSSHRSLPNNTETKGVYRKHTGSNFQFKDKTMFDTVNMI